MGNNAAINGVITGLIKTGVGSVWEVDLPGFYIGKGMKNEQIRKHTDRVTTLGPSLTSG
jgi:hypothetical protein